MSSINAQIAQAKEKAAQVERQRKLQQNREKEQQRKIDTRRNIIIGKMVADYFPAVLEFKPRRTIAENISEFAPFAAFLSILADDKIYIALLKEKAIQNQFLEQHEDVITVSLNL